MNTKDDIIAALRKELRAAKESAAYWEKDSEHERAQRQKEIGMQEYRGNTVSYIYDKERNYGAHFDRMRGEIEIQKNLLIEVLKTIDDPSIPHLPLHRELIARIRNQTADKTTP